MAPDGKLTKVRCLMLRSLQAGRHTGSSFHVFVLFCFVFLGPHLQHMAVPQLGVKAEL